MNYTKIMEKVNERFLIEVWWWLYAAVYQSKVGVSMDRSVDEPGINAGNGTTNVLMFSRN